MQNKKYKFIFNQMKRRFYLAYPIWQTVSAKSSRSYYIELLGVSDITAASFMKSNLFMKIGLSGNWREISNKIFVSEYQLYLPDKKQLQKKLKAIMQGE
jgi:hypothetical protein